MRVRSLSVWCRLVVFVLATSSYLSGTQNASATTVAYFNYAAFSAAAGPLNIVTFDSIPKGTALVGNEFPGLNITARAINVVNPSDRSPLTEPVGSANVNSQPKGMSVSLSYFADILFPDFEDDSATFDFLVPTRAVGLWIGNLGDGEGVSPTLVQFLNDIGSPVQAEFIDANHVGQIGSGTNNRLFYGVISDGNIDKIVVQNRNDSDVIFYDDIQWAGAVPEPGSCLLFIVGALLISVKSINKYRI